MSVEPIDPTPFEPAMPESVREVIARARNGEGPAKEWLVSRGGGWGQVGDCFGMIRSVPEALPPEVVGWLVGIAMFGDDLHVLPRMMIRERARGPAPHALAAFAAGIRSGVPVIGRQWKGVEELVGFVEEVPAALVEVLADGIVSDQALTRGVALRVAHKLGAAARAALEGRAGEFSGKEKRRLEEAVAALDAGHRDRDREEGGAGAAGDAEDLLGRLLLEWGRVKDPEVRAAIERVGAVAGRGREALKARSKGELEGAWLALASARDPVDVDRLLGAGWPGAWKTALVRVRALAQFSPDPRILRRLLEVAPLYESWASHPLHTAIAGIHAKWVDPTCVAQIRDEMARRGHYAPREYTNAIAAIEACVIGTGDGALLEEVRRTAEPVRDLAGLWRWFYEEPGEGERRLVLADALQAAGDPRGEFIVLQAALVDGGDAKMRRRAHELLEANTDAWSGHLPSILRSSRRFERGFLVAAQTSATPQALRASLEMPEWRTIEELVLRTSNQEGVVLELVARMPRLRTLVHFDEATLIALAGGDPRPSIRALGFGSRWMPEAPMPGLPNLAVLAGTWFRYRWDENVFRERCEAVAKSGIQAIVHAALEREHLVDALRIVKDAGPPETRFSLDNQWNSAFDGEGWRIRVRRGTTEADVAWAGGAAYWHGTLAEILPMLASTGRDRIRVHITRSVKGAPLETAKEVAKKLGEGGVEVTFDGAPIDLAAPP